MKAGIVALLLSGIVVSGYAAVITINDANAGRTDDTTLRDGENAVLDGLGDAISYHFPHDVGTFIAGDGVNTHPVFVFQMTGTANAADIENANFSVTLIGKQNVPDWNVDAHVIRKAASSEILVSDYETSAVSLMTGFNTPSDTVGNYDLSIAGQTTFTTWLQSNWVENQYLFIGLKSNPTILAKPGTVGGDNTYYRYGVATPEATGWTAGKTDAQLTINVDGSTSAPADPVVLEMVRNNGTLDFVWNSNSGKLYDLESTESLTFPAWAVYNDYTNMAHDVSGTNTLNGVAADGPVRFFRVMEKKKLNVVFILIDDMGWSDVGCYGSPFYDTPNIDRLADDGMLFTDAYATSHVCSPSRASILTGKYPARLKLTDWLPGRGDLEFQRLLNAEKIQGLPLEETTIAGALRDQGYRTGMFGKWHLGEGAAGPLHHGFDVQVPQNWYRGWPRSGYHYPFDMDGIDGEPGDYLTDKLTDEALRFIDESKDQPFFLYMSYFAVHDPIQGRADLVEKYTQKRDDLPSNDKPFLLEGNPDSETTFTPEELDQMITTPEYAEYKLLPNQMVKIKQRQDNPQFAAQVECVDENVGRLLARLEQLGLDDNTIVIFTSDNGGMSAANFFNPDRVINPNRLDTAYAGSCLPLRGAKGWMYEGGLRVPLIIKWPGTVEAGSVSAEPVIGTDFYPTILDMLGVPPEPLQHVDGTSLTPLFAGEGIGRDAIYWHFPHYSNHGLQSPGGAIRSGNYKLLDYFENGTVQLFDLAVDPGEQNDLSKIEVEKTMVLKAKLDQWRISVGAKMMPPNPLYNP